MEAAIQTLVKVFLKSTKGKESLGKKEFQSLCKTQLSNIMSGTDSNDAVNTMGQGLDADHDGKVGFEEYMKLVGYLATSLSEQRTLANEQPAKNAASGQVAQSCADTEEEKPEATAEATAEATEEAQPEANEEAKADGAAEVKLEANTEAPVDVKVEVKGDGETLPEVAIEDPAAAAAAAVTAAATEAAEVPAVEVAASSVEVVVNEEVKVDETGKVEEVVETVTTVVEEVVEKKTEEATS